MRTPQWLRGLEPQPTHLPAGESCGSELVLPPRALGVLSSLCFKGGGWKAPLPHPRGPGDSLARWGRAAGAWMADPDRPGEHPDFNPVLFFLAQCTVPQRWVPATLPCPRSGPLCLLDEVGCSGAGPGLVLAALPLFCLPACLRSWCLRSVETWAFSLRQRAAGALGGPQSLLYFQRLLCIWLLSRERPGDSREARWPDGETEGSILLRVALWDLGCSQHLCASLSGGTEHEASQRCHALYSQVTGIQVSRTCSPRGPRLCLERPGL